MVMCIMVDLRMAEGQVYLYKYFKITNTIMVTTKTICSMARDFTTGTLHNIF